MNCRLSIRSYTFDQQKHAHKFHQLVIPLVGSVNIDVNSQKGCVTPGMCVIYPAGVEHLFSPDKAGYFLVADIDQLPVALEQNTNLIVRLPSSVQAFCSFIHHQLESNPSIQLQKKVGEWFITLLIEQPFLPPVSNRIANVLAYIEKDLDKYPSLEKLASICCLSQSQFKVLFKKELGISTSKYIYQLRMNKAKALLINTDYPIKTIASYVGYQDISTFSHRFSHHFGHPPSKLRS